MRYAIVSDLHANLQAWNAVLTDIGTNNIDSIICLGDIVGYGPDPVKVLESAYRHVHAFVLGNHDAVACGKMSPDAFNARAKSLILWTKDKLGRRAADFLSSLPLTLEGNGFRCAHGCFNNPAAFGYILSKNDAAASWGSVREPLLFVGHTHTPGIFVVGNSGTPHYLKAQDFVLEEGKRFIVNVGSVGSPREDKDIRSCYVIYDDSDQSVIFRRLPFDFDAFRAAVLRAGFTEDDVPLLRFDPRKKMAAIRDAEKFASNPALEDETRRFTTIAKPDVPHEQPAAEKNNLHDISGELGFIPAETRAQEAQNVVEVAAIEEKLRKTASHWRLFSIISVSFIAVVLLIGGIAFTLFKSGQRPLAIPPGRVAPVSSVIPPGSDGNYLPDLPDMIGADQGARPWRIVYENPKKQAIEISGSRLVLRSASEKKELRFEAPGIKLEDDKRNFEITGRIMRSPDFTGKFNIVVDVFYTASRGAAPEWVVNYESIQFRASKKSDYGWELARRTIEFPKSAREVRVYLSGNFSGKVDVQSFKMQLKNEPSKITKIMDVISD